MFWGAMKGLNACVKLTVVGWRKGVGLFEYSVRCPTDTFISNICNG